MADPKLSLSVEDTGANPLIRVASNKEIQEVERNAADAQAKQSQIEISAMASHIQNTYTLNMNYRKNEGIDDRMIRDLQQRNSEYDPEKIAEILRQGGANVFIGLTGVKCRGAEGWLNEVWQSDAPRSYAFKRTPLPDLPTPAVDAIVDHVGSQMAADAEAGREQMSKKQASDLAMFFRDELERALDEEAQERADRMEKLVDDQRTEGGWDKAFDEFVYDLTTMPVAVIKGPVVRREKKLTWPKSGNRSKPVVKDKIVHKYYRVSPFDIYPSEGAVDINDGELIERQWLSRKELVELKNLPNYDGDAIDLVLTRHRDGDVVNTWTFTDQRRSELELKGQTTTVMARRDQVEALEYWGRMQGRMLIERGIFLDPDGKAINPIQEYDVNAIMADKFVIYISFNQDPLGRRPYSKTGWGKIPGSFWFQSIPNQMRDLQQICNSSIRALVANLGIASGPQIVVNDTNRLPVGGKITSMFPWKVWQFTNQMKAQGKPIDFFQPRSNSAELISIYREFAKMSDDFTGIPAYSYGNERVAGAGRTFSGLSLLMTSAARGIKKVIDRVDNEVINDTLQRQYDWNMQFGKDQTVKGDAQIEVNGSLAVILRQQLAKQRLDFLGALQGNQLAQEIVGVEGTANLLRAGAASLQMGDEEVVPDKDKIKVLAERVKEAQAQAVAQAQQQAGGGGAGQQQPQAAAA